MTDKQHVSAYTARLKLAWTTVLFRSRIFKLWGLKLTIHRTIRTCADIYADLSIHWTDIPFLMWINARLDANLKKKTSCFFSCVFSAWLSHSIGSLSNRPRMFTVFTNRNYLGQFREIPWNHTSDVHRGSTLTTWRCRYITWRWRHINHANTITSVFVAKQTVINEVYVFNKISL